MTVRSEAQRNPLIPQIVIRRPLYTGFAISIVVALLRAAQQLSEGTPVEELVSSFLTYFPLTFLAPIFTQLVSISARQEQFTPLFDSQIVRVLTANERMAKLEPDMRDGQEFNLQVDLVTYWRRSEELAAETPGVGGLIRWKKSAIQRELEKSVRDLKDGVLPIDDSDQELELNVLIFELLQPDFVRAVSWNDEGFWMSPKGAALIRRERAYLDEKPGRKIHRLFYTKPGFTRDDYQRIFDQQAATVKFVELAKVRRPEDHVIYDDACLKESKKVGTGDAGDELKEAKVHLNPTTVKTGILRFEDNWSGAAESTREGLTA